MRHQIVWVPSFIFHEDTSMKGDGTLSTVTQARYNNIDDEFGFDDSTLPLNGRSKEILKLLGAYHDLLYHCNGTSLSKKAIVVVHGESGSGKTSLVETLWEPVSNSNGFFIAGKFFQPSDGVKHEPHSAIMAAFSDLCDLVLLSDDLDNHRRLEIQKFIGLYAQILVQSISNLTPFFDAKIDFGYNDTINDTTMVKFRDACRQFLRAMSSDEHPIVLFLDDVQWMDEGSQMLIEMMLSKDDLIKKIYIILAYRDDEPSTISNILMDREDIIDIKLSDLDHGSVNQIVSALLASPSTKVSTLSTYIKSRTMEIPFYVMQFMKILRKEGLLWFDRSNGVWIFDMHDI
jgi:predicted ATPase